MMMMMMIIIIIIIIIVCMLVLTVHLQCTYFLKEVHNTQYITWYYFPLIFLSIFFPTMTLSFKWPHILDFVQTFCFSHFRIT
jgi:hypothetical protein